MSFLRLKSEFVHRPPSHGFSYFFNVTDVDEAITWNGHPVAMSKHAKTRVRNYSAPSIPPKGRKDMSFLAWIVLGLIAGFIGSKLVNKTGEGFIGDVLLGIVGAVVGGWLFSTIGQPGVTGLNIYSVLVAVIGSVVLLMAYHMIFRRVG